MQQTPVSPAVPAGLQARQPDPAVQAGLAVRYAQGREVPSGRIHLSRRPKG